MDAPRQGAVGYGSGNFYAAIGGEEGDQNKAEGRHRKSDRLDPRCEPAVGRRRSNEAGKKPQRNSPGQESGEGNRAELRVSELRDLLEQRVVGGLQQRLDRD